MINKYAKFAAAVAAIHLLQYIADYAYFRYCSYNLFWALFTRGSPVCQTLRVTSDAFSGTLVKFLGGSFLVAIHHPLNQLLEGGPGAPPKNSESL